MKKTTEERFWEKVEKTDGCWFWTGGVNGSGYGSILHYGKAIKVHRFSYELSYGLIAETLEAHHKCGNKICVNPEHIQLINKVFHAQHHRQFRKKPIKCIHGHRYTLQNTYIDKRGYMTCKACKKKRNRRKRLQALADLEG